MDGLVGSISGDVLIRSHIEGMPEDAEKLGVKIAEEILSQGAKEILEEVYNKCTPGVDEEIH
jgi:hydroxymethylbilane synthase